jgi:ABC-type Na+ efflux pump permease subunit
LEQAQEHFDREFKEPIQAWWKGLPPKEAEEYGSGLSKSRYKRVDVETSGPDPEAKLREMVNEEKLFAYFVIGPDPVESSEGCKYVSNNLTDDALLNWFNRYATAEVSSRRIDEVGIGAEKARWIKEPVKFESKQISETGEEEGVSEQEKLHQFAPVAFVYLLWLSVFMIAQMLMTNTIEEKSNKIMEVLLSSVSPIQLMAGKILGIATTGLTMIASWILFFLAILKLVPLFVDKPMTIDFTVIIRDPIYITSFVAYFILGYLLLSAILVGIGSVCNSLKEAQNLMAPVTIMLIVPLIAMVPIGQDPNGTIAKVLSYIPPFTPFVMMNRAAGPPAPMEYVITTILLVVSIVLALWAAAKVFRIGILMTGKPPKLGEILRWIRAPVGQIPDRRQP